MDWFQPVAAQLRRLKEATQQKAVATSAVARASVIVEGRLAERLVEELERRREALLAPLREIGEDATPEVVHELAVSASTLAFLDKWIGQLREGLLLLRM